MERGAEVLYNPYRSLLLGDGIAAFRALFNAERQYMVEEGYVENQNLIRSEAVSFIAQLERECSDAFVPYMAMTYFDRFISRHEIPEVLLFPEENKTLFLICCLTLAAKLRTNNFELSTFLHDRTCYFAASDVLRMELHICEILNWRLRTLTPIFFAEYFIELLHLPLDYPSPRPSIHQLIIKSQADITFTAYRPSAVAASAVLAVSSKMFPARANELNFRNHSSEFLNRKLALLYEGLTVMVVGEASTSADRPDTQGTPSSADRTDTQGTPVSVGEASSSHGTHPHVAEQAEVEMVRRAGMEPAVGEGEAEAEADENGKDLVQALDVPMAFKLEWEVNNDTHRNLVQEATLGDVAANFTQKLNDLAKTVSDCCTVL
ncbi:putative cyclin-D6-1 isoform X2 [Sesamum indicum]|uniref:Cyclin-D6-1 isoform X2 n=1 Tax=Sesamum indicum TaxID=4182 RepID=A0A6I9UIW6_SESIN|nr:putative cyclin-D6-1 isoform X2 [Sesamum indicum]